MEIIIIFDFVLICAAVISVIYSKYTNKSIKDIKKEFIYNHRMNKLRKGRIKEKTLYLNQDKYLDCICRWLIAAEPECIDCFLRKYTVYAKLNTFPMDWVKKIYSFYLEQKNFHIECLNDLELIDQDIVMIEKYSSELKLFNQDIEIIEKYLE